MDNLFIAAAMQDSDLSNSFLECTHLSLFKREDAGWKAVRQVPVELPDFTAPSDFRDRLRGLIDAVGEDCRILAGRNISGLAFNVFDRMGFYIFDIIEISDACFDGILSDIEAGDEAARIRRETLENARPVETDTPGHYYLDLIMLQDSNPDVSSKKAIRTFLEDTPFLELELRCSHLPPWMEDMGYEIRTSPSSGGAVKATVINRFCK